MTQRWNLEDLQKELRPPSRRLATRPRRAAVLVPIIDDGGPQRLLLTRRTDQVGTHKGHVAFPGGHLEEQDATLRDTALRETWEEGTHVETCCIACDFCADYGHMCGSGYRGGHGAPR